MKTVRINYTVKQAFVEQNKMNIQKVMDELQTLENIGLQYFAFVGADGKTFTHLAFFETDEEQKRLVMLPAFKHFQEALKLSSPEVPPQQEVLTMVAASTSTITQNQ